MITICCSLRGIYDTETFVISFLTVQSNYTKLLIMNKDSIWSSYNIHFVSLHHYKEPSSSSSSHFNAAVNLKASTSPSFSSSNPKAFDHRPIQGGGGRGGGRFNLAWLALDLTGGHQWTQICPRRWEFSETDLQKFKCSGVCFKLNDA